MTGALYQGLSQNSVPFNRPFEQRTPEQKLQEVCNVLGIGTQIRNPDLTYELTSDNVMKMLAIYMRFRCNIPVVIMGETGSGKTRLIRFLCELLRLERQAENLLILKTHGGVTEENIHAIVHKAIDRARANKQLGVNLTVLFFDEANTTNAIGTIKEVMCDRLVNGFPIPDDIGLQFVAAVNPYREHSEEMIRRLEKAGLGYHIKTDRMTDRLGGGGGIPMRRLVYRVKEIPPSMFPLIWDFGSLDNETELKYIRQMVDTRSCSLSCPDRRASCGG
jgi:energy-coupling factor transporter ATP-binding protein EcfA2